ncbi:phosphate acetyltransferase [Rhodopseudomonas sp. BAL398]|uniref:phosphate acetyltransferase n=1 Tax=Rhodopseudomonas sp. BAL398 TaxID=3034676 RepID=UPI00294B372C|nr:phosphate acetyltransferase [Rhodopseudomonas sp. BAL398]WOK18786.1 phosphate acetyltransferase [Rhodopseudomonas sp. BAL398]
MNNSRHRTFYLVPVSREAGLTSMTLGLVRALQLTGVKVGFVKPIMQPEIRSGDLDLAAHFARTLCGVRTPDPIAFDHAAEMVRSGQLGGLMEEVVSMVDTVQADCDIVIVEGLIPDVEFQIATRLNIEIIRSLGADLIPVLAGGSHDAAALAAKAAAAAEQYGDDGRRPIAGLLINRCIDAAAALALTERGALTLNGSNPVPILAAVPSAAHLLAPHLIDIADTLGLTILNRGGIDTTRVLNVVVAARSPEKLIGTLRPETLVVTPADRSDAILATALVAQRGMALAGLVLTCGGRPAPELAAILASAPLDRLAVLCTDDDTFTTASKLANLSAHVSRADGDRMERVIAFIAEKVETRPLALRLDLPVETLMPPPVFRHRLVARARAALRRIVLPEGEEPRTIRAAAICADKRIARCILLGAPERIREVAAAHGIELPDNLEIVDAEQQRGRYVAPLVELRKAKGLTKLQAEIALEDSVVLGTMMLAQNDVDGLVSGAVHTTASTVRPALQLIKTAPGSSIVSSVFFMLMPDQVLVYGDCAINPDPTDHELAEIAIQSADSAAAFGIEPRVAMISYSTGASGAGEDVDKVRRATDKVRALRPDLIVDGPIQYDAATVASVGRQKAPGGPLDGRANVFVFPDLNTGNTTYKAVQRSANVVSVGPMLQGLRKPVNDLSRGALVDDIVYTIAITAIQAAAGDKPGTAAMAAAAE